MPAYTPNCQHDLFISYGSVDDQSGDTGEQGWVSSFVDDLKKRLSERLGRRDSFLFWKDEEQLSRHVDFAEQISQAIQRSACLLIVLSPGYLKSAWCQRERSDFLKWVRDRDASGSRIFVVERDWIEGDKPAELKHLLGFQLWTGDPLSKDDLPRPLDKNRASDRDEYKDQLNAIALALESELRRLKTERPPIAGRPAEGTSPVAAAARAAERAATATVFLAEVTDDLRPQWKKVRSELDQQGLRVVSGGAPRDVAALESRVAQALEESRVFVQLLSQFPGQPLPGSSETYALLQCRLAVEAQKQILQWRSPRLTEDVFDEQEAEDAGLAELHRRLVFGRVRAEHIEDFKRHVIDVATTPPRPAPATVGRGMVFVSFNPAGGDSQFVEDLCGYLQQRGFGIVTPCNADDDDPKEIRADFEKNVLGSRGWIVVYGEQRQKYWTRGQLNEINQLLCQQERPDGAIYLCAGPPAPKDVNSPLKLLGMNLPGMQVIDCQNGFDVEKLYPLLDALSDSADGRRADRLAAGEVAVVCD